MGLNNSDTEPHQEADHSLIKALTAPLKPNRKGNKVGSVQKFVRKVVLTERHPPVGRDTCLFLGTPCGWPMRAELGATGTTV